MGTYRLILAILVILNHLDITINGFRMGSVAVVSFFILSGYVMTALIRKYYLSPEQIPQFYLDRVMRLFPQFLFYFGATLVLILIGHPKGLYISDITPIKVFLNALMLPLGFYMYGLFNCQIIPQAWSLGLESMFYLVIPLLIVYRLRWPAFLFSFAIFVLAHFKWVNPEYFSYRLLPGTLFFFLFGSYMQHSEKNREKWLLLLVYVIGLFFLIMAIISEPIAQTDYNRQVLFGLIFGFPIVSYLSKQRWGKIDAVLGNISYGVFLNHFFLIWMFQCIGFDTAKVPYILLLLCISVLFSWITYSFIERPVIAYRHKLRNERHLHAEDGLYANVVSS